MKIGLKTDPIATDNNIDRYEVSKRVELSTRVEYTLLALLKLADCCPEAKPLTVNEIAIDRASKVYPTPIGENIVLAKVNLTVQQGKFICNA